jgi:hypothetical protein
MWLDLTWNRQIKCNCYYDSMARRMDLLTAVCYICGLLGKMLAFTYSFLMYVNMYE